MTEDNDVTVAPRVESGLVLSPLADPPGDALRDLADQWRGRLVDDDAGLKARYGRELADGVAGCRVRVRGGALNSGVVGRRPAPHRRDRAGRVTIRAGEIKLVALAKGRTLSVGPRSS